MEHLDARRDMDLIIPRALFATTPNTFDDDIRKLEDIYTQTEIATVLKATKEHISNKVCELVAHRYHISVFQRFYRPKR
jgi:site-specific recombinase XerD